MGQPNPDLPTHLQKIPGRHRPAPLIKPALFGHSHDPRMTLETLEFTRSLRQRAKHIPSPANARKDYHHCDGRIICFTFLFLRIFTSHRGGSARSDRFTARQGRQCTLHMNATPESAKTRNACTACPKRQGAIRTLTVQSQWCDRSRCTAVKFLVLLQHRG